MKPLTCLLLVGITVFAHAAVPGMKEVARVGNKIYFIEANVVKETDTKSWEDAVSFCNGKNLNLASFLNQEQFDGLYKWHKTFGPSVYIGASDKESEGTWYWHQNSNRKPIKYSNWGENEPQTGEYNSCSSMSNDGKWRASYCDVAYAHVLCESMV